MSSQSSQVSNQLQNTPPKPGRPYRLSRSEHSGFVIVCFRPGAIDPIKRTLLSAARAKRFHRLVKLLKRLKLDGAPLITAVKADDLLMLEKAAKKTNFPPIRSLTQYWRIDARRYSAALENLELSCHQWSEIEVIYREKNPRQPTARSRAVRGASYKFLREAPEGIDARWFWKKYPEIDGKDLNFIDVEQGWPLKNKNLPPTEMIFNENYNAKKARDHGAAVLGIVAGLHHAGGCRGIVPKLGSVRSSSIYSRERGPLQVADAIVAAAAASPQAHVLLIEVQLGKIAYLPAETEQANFDAIRLAVAQGIVVVEAAGNGDQNLDHWVSWDGKHYLNRKSRPYNDSGAIMVGAAEANSPHNRWCEPELKTGSNYGSRIDCYAWGQSIATAGSGGPRRGSQRASPYPHGFRGTSGASAIIAGAALLLQGFSAQFFGRLSPIKTRAFLSSPKDGTKQGRNRKGKIGSMPSLKRIITSYLRTHHPK